MCFTMSPYDFVTHIEFCTIVDLEILESVFLSPRELKNLKHRKIWLWLIHFVDWLKLVFGLDVVCRVGFKNL